MTDEEITFEELQKIVNSPLKNKRTIKDFAKTIYDLSNKNKQLEKENEELMNALEKTVPLKLANQLKNENAELKRDKTELVNSVTELKNKVAELEKQIEKMQCCLNCKHQTPKTKDDFLFCCECKQLDKQKEKIILTKWECVE